MTNDMTNTASTLLTGALADDLIGGVNADASPDAIITTATNAAKPTRAGRTPKIGRPGRPSTAAEAEAVNEKADLDQIIATIILDGEIEENEEDAANGIDTIPGGTLELTGAVTSAEALRASVSAFDSIMTTAKQAVDGGLEAKRAELDGEIQRAAEIAAELRDLSTQHHADLLRVRQWLYNDNAAARLRALPGARFTVERLGALVDMTIRELQTAAALAEIPTRVRKLDAEDFDRGRHPNQRVVANIREDVRTSAGLPRAVRENTAEIALLLGKLTARTMPADIAGARLISVISPETENTLERAAGRGYPTRAIGEFDPLGA